MDTLQRPHALYDWPEFKLALAGQPLHIFLDYDGTLTPIVARPEQAILDPGTRHTLEQLAQHHSVAVISGRELADVRQRVGLPQLFYAGNHGLEIVGPDAALHHWQFGQEHTAKIDAFYHSLRQHPAMRSELIIEHKRFSLSVHYRLLQEVFIPTLQQALIEILVDYPQLHLRKGKKVFEIRPAIDWHKGKAMRHLARFFDRQSQQNGQVLFIGDDLTDEDAFNELKSTDLGILVTTHARKTAARFRLDDPMQVQQLLTRLQQLTNI